MKVCCSRCNQKGEGPGPGGPEDTNWGFCPACYAWLIGMFTRTGRGAEDTLDGALAEIMPLLGPRQSEAAERLLDEVTETLCRIGAPVFRLCRDRGEDVFYMFCAHPDDGLDYDSLYPRDMFLYLRDNDPEPFVALDFSPDGSVLSA